MRFSFLGVGNMGFPLAMNLVKAGEDVRIYSRRADCAGAFSRAGARVAGTVADLADCDVLCTCLPLPRHVEEAVLGEQGLYAAMSPGAVHLEFSTLDPATARSLAAAAAARGIGYVQATVSKTPEVAARGEAPLFVGGTPDDVKRLMPVLEKIGKPQDLKSVDAACAVKLISNLIGMSNVALVAEGLRIGQLAGMDGRRLLDLLLDTGCASFQMQTRGPWMLEEDFTARFSIDIAAKDLRLGCTMARDWGYTPRLMTQTLEYLRQGHAEGIGDEDVCALFKVTRP
ncbi:MAG: NAD(P)-dependent oxidoreductase [Desulfovibrionaceae bacterium]|nr:NAD(P)-dependent oxidoreductase [Desulfovibrionaceae bacterium]